MVLSIDTLQASSDYYKSKIIDYKVIEKPKHGKIVVHGGVNANRFTQNQLQSGNVKYSHSGLSEALDAIRLIARTASKLSEPFVLSIVPYSEDNESPKVVANSPSACSLNRKCPIESRNLRKSRIF